VLTGIPRDAAAKSVERIADHATTIARMASEIESPLPQRLVGDLSKVSDLTSSVWRMP